KDMLKHFSEAFAVMRVPQQVKTDNGPVYKSKEVALFLQDWGVTHVFGVPHNSTGQAIIEQAHRT
ncbi:POK11 protein, partial [Piprites chloris]|nr:POK11 protein [Piprites chloris]